MLKTRFSQNKTIPQVTLGNIIHKYLKNLGGCLLKLFGGAYECISLYSQNKPIQVFG